MCSYYTVLFYSYLNVKYYIIWKSCTIKRIKKEIQQKSIISCYLFLDSGDVQQCDTKRQMNNNGISDRSTPNSGVNIVANWELRNKEKNEQLVIIVSYKTYPAMFSKKLICA